MNYKFENDSIFFKILLTSLITISIITSCGPKKTESKEEQIALDSSDPRTTPDSILNSVQGNSSFAQVATRPTSVILTGMADHRLVTIYKSKADVVMSGGDVQYWSGDYDGDESEKEEHFMPGIDILYGYNLLSIAHYDLKTEKLNYLFKQPALIKTLYYPSFEQDSLDKKPINRNYYIVSVYDEDTNKDTLINKKDLRKFYHFDSTSTVKTQLVPSDYSVIRSQYDSQNDVMYIFAKHDENKNGVGDKKEPVHIFWFSLKAPAKAKRLY